MVERQLPKLNVAGSIPVSRSMHVPHVDAAKAQFTESLYKAHLTCAVAGCFYSRLYAALQAC